MKKILLMLMCSVLLLGASCSNKAQTESTELQNDSIELCTEDTLAQDTILENPQTVEVDSIE